MLVKKKIVGEQVNRENRFFPTPPHLNFGKVGIQKVTHPANPAPYISIWISTKNVLAVLPLLRDGKIKVNGPANHGQYKIVRSSPIYRRELCRLRAVAWGDHWVGEGYCAWIFKKHALFTIRSTPVESINLESSIAVF